MPPEENGHASLLCDLLKLNRTFSLQRYWVDVAGFALAWLLVFVFIGFYCWMATWK